MSSRFVLTVIIILLSFTSISNAADKKSEAHLEKIGNIPLTTLNSFYLFQSAETCIVRHDSGLYWRIDGWVTGNELYKSYLNPAASCNNPYPFTIIAVNMPMIFDDATPLDVSVDIEEVDSISYPNCPVPGDPLAISQEYNLNVPDGGGLFDIWIPLDTPIVVNGPFFAGFFISNLVDTGSYAAVITDNHPPDSCVSFNVWDMDIGLVDLNNNPYYNFPGRLVLYAAGIPGGTPQPAPKISVLSPKANDTLFQSVNIWVHDTSGSNIIDHVVFYYAP